MDILKPKPKNARPASNDTEFDVYEDIVDAAVEGGNAMSSSEPFGALIGAAIGAVEEGRALLSPKKTKKD